jgi:uncharacterized protein YggT (Ycf19 family)
MTVERRDEVHVTRDVPTTAAGTVERRVDVVEDPNAGWYTFVARLIRLFWWLAGILILFIGMHVVLVLINANTANGFTQFINNVTDLFLRPFVGLTTMPQVGAGRLDIPAIVAMFVYAILAWVITDLLRLLFAPGRRAAVRRTSILRRAR